MLKAPFPYFGGKSLGADLAWSLLGDVKNYVEPFAGSLAVLLARPSPVNGPETVNDWSCQLVNAWRAIQQNPEDLAARCVGPSAEVNTEAQHYQLIESAEALRTALGDPSYCNIDAAAWYIKGAAEWIGSGWCSGEGPWQWSRETGWVKRAGKGVNRQLPHLGDAGTGVNRQLPHLGDAGKGVNRQLPHLGNAGKGVNRQLPHLGDAGTGQYGQRVAWVTDWLCALRDRLCHTRIACGDWSRVLGPSSTTSKHPGVTGVFLDPPYASTEYVYGKQTDMSLSDQCFAWCVENGDNPKLRIVLAGRGSEHDGLQLIGWTRHDWKTWSGYAAGGNQEAYWASPHCV